MEPVRAECKITGKQLFALVDQLMQFSSPGRLPISEGQAADHNCEGGSLSESKISLNDDKPPSGCRRAKSQPKKFGLLDKRTSTSSPFLLGTSRLDYDTKAEYAWDWVSVEEQKPAAAPTRCVPRVTYVDLETEPFSERRRTFPPITGDGHLYHGPRGRDRGTGYGGDDGQTS